MTLCFDGDCVIKLFLDMKVGIGGDKWPAAELFCSFVTSASWKTFFASLVHGRDCCELGSGNGIAGILISKCFAPRSMVITDMQSHVAHIENNIERNSGYTNGVQPVAEELDWLLDGRRSPPPPMDNNNNDADARNVNPPKKYDVLFALECVYNEDLYQPLLSSIVRHSHAHSVTFLALSRDFSKPLFFDLLTKTRTKTLVETNTSGTKTDSYYYQLDYKKIPHATIAAALPGEWADRPSAGIFVLYLRKMKCKHP